MRKGVYSTLYIEGKRLTRHTYSSTNQVSSTIYDRRSGRLAYWLALLGARLLRWSQSMSTKEFRWVWPVGSTGHIGVGNLSYTEAFSVTIEILRPER